METRTHTLTHTHAGGLLFPPGTVIFALVIRFELPDLPFSLKALKRVTFTKGIGPKGTFLVLWKQPKRRWSRDSMKQSWKAALNRSG